MFKKIVKSIAAIKTENDRDECYWQIDRAFEEERIIVELAAAFYNASLWEMPGFEMVSGTCDTAFALILEAFRLRRAKLFCKDGEVSAEWEERK